MTTSVQDIDQAKLDEFMGRFVGDLGAALSAALVVIGDQLGLYRAMADGEPVTPEELAQRTGTDARYVREWLSNQAAGGYVTYDARGATFSLSPEQSFALAQEGSPAFIPGAFQLATAAIKDEPKITEAFRTGEGVGWHEHHHDLFAGPSGSSGPATWRTSSPRGSPRSTACRPSSRRARSWPTSAAATAHRRS
jgi:hypothetical protein